jgi:hypothetical protein
MASPFSWPVLVPCALRAPAPVNLGVRPSRMSIAQIASESILASRLALSTKLAEKWTNTAECTSLLTESIAEILLTHDAIVTFEAKLPERPRREGGRSVSGQLDVLARFQDQSHLAVEIDRDYKKWSLDKLRHASSFYKAETIWVRWDGGPPPKRYGTIQVLDLTIASEIFLRKKKLFDAYSEREA